MDCVKKNVGAATDNHRTLNLSSVPFKSLSTFLMKLIIQDSVCENIKKLNVFITRKALGYLKKKYN